jgi:hypothetical protein
MDKPQPISELTTQFPQGWREQWKLLSATSVLHIASCMVFSVSVSPITDSAERRKALVSVVNESTLPIDDDIANLMAAQAVKFVLDP